MRADQSTATEPTEAPLSKEGLGEAIVAALQSQAQDEPSGDWRRPAPWDNILRALIVVALTGGGYYAERAASTIEALVVLPQKVDTMTQRMDSLEAALTDNTETMKLVRSYTVPEPPAPVRPGGAPTP